MHIDTFLGPDGFPTSGEGNFIVQTTIMEWTYGSGSSYDWAVWAGQQQVSSGTAVLPCGNQGSGSRDGSVQTAWLRSGQNPLLVAVFVCEDEVHTRTVTACGEDTPLVRLR